MPERDSRSNREHQRGGTPDLEADASAADLPDGQSNAYIDEGEAQDVGADIFARGLCLPSDNKMTEEQQDRIIEVIHRCFA